MKMVPFIYVHSYPFIMIGPKAVWATHCASLAVANQLGMDVAVKPSIRISGYIQK